jgi:hypothetical protein
MWTTSSAPGRPATRSSQGGGASWRLPARLLGRLLGGATTNPGELLGFWDRGVPAPPLLTTPEQHSSMVAARAHLKIEKQCEELSNESIGKLQRGS